MIRAQICITNTGVQPLGGIFEIFTFPTPGWLSQFQSGISVNSLTGSSCPYVVFVPDGTTSILVRDTLSGCAVELPIQDNDVCLTCNFGLSNVNNTIPGRLNVGELTGTCQSAITDYRIFWYGPNDTNTLRYVSGKGSAFASSPYGYNFTHPLTSNNAILAFAGLYTPVIDKVIINGVNFSQTATTGFIQSDLNCLSGVTVVNVPPLTCSNGTNTNTTWPFGNYTHRVNFSNDTSGSLPLVLTSTFNLSPSTTLFAYAFRGFDVSDTLKISYSGSSYPMPIVLENIECGLDLNLSDFTLSASTKKWDSNNFFHKVISLSGLTRSSGDFLFLEVTPNSANTQTNWDFYFTCLTGFNETICYTQSNPAYKIIASSVTGTSTNPSCNVYNARFQISGCSLNQWRQSDIMKYMTPDFTHFQSSIATILQMNFNQFESGNTICGNPGIYYGDATCANPTGSTIIYQKSNGNLNIQFSSLNDLSAYYNSYLTVLSASGTPLNNLNINYYRTFRIRLPIITTPTTICGDGSGFRDYNMHFTSVVTTGTTVTGFSINFTMPTITNGLTGFGGPCSNCTFWTNSIVNSVNNSSSGTNFTATTVVGSRLKQPIWFVDFRTSGVTNVTSQGTNLNNQIFEYSNKTIPFTGSPLTIVPSLSGIASPLSGTSSFFNQSNPTFLNRRFYTQTVWFWNVVRPLGFAFDSYEIRTSPISNFVYSGWPGTAITTTIGLWSANTLTIYDPNYFI